jgi:hypothetical protein
MSSPIMKIRRLAALDWAQLTALLHVSRQDLDSWISGAAIPQNSIDHIERLMATINYIDRGSSNLTRDALLAYSNNSSGFKLLCERKYEEAEVLLGKGLGREELILKPLSQAAVDARKPSPPADLIGALQDTVHVEIGKLRSAKSIKVRMRK